MYFQLNTHMALNEHTFYDSSVSTDSKSFELYRANYVEIIVGQIFIKTYFWR